MYVWRLCALGPASRLDGLEASRRGGRWNSPGLPAVYAALSPATCLLEAFLHVAPEDLPESCMLARIKVPDDASRRALRLTAFPRGWASSDELDWFRRTGDAWLTSGETLLLLVPSVLVPAERNVVLNPRHPDMARVRVCHTERFRIDDRLRARFGVGGVLTPP